MGTGEQAESEFIVLVSRDEEEGGDWQIAGWGLVRRSCNVRVRVIEGG